MAFGLTGADAEPHLSYGSYLKIPELLQLQKLLSDPPQHDELLFIVIHQVYELWFRQLLHELDAVVRCLDDDDVLGAHRLLGRCTEIQRVLIAQIKVLQTMTPDDFLTFRDRLMPASGFQSAQFRCIEYLCGLKDASHLDHQHAGSAGRAAMEARLHAPSLGERFHALLRRRGLDASETDHDRLVRALVGLYHDPNAHYDLYLLSEELVEFDQMFSLWRLHHVSMVERMIGAKHGTGGSEGVAYLRNTLDRRFFPELWELRSHLSQKSLRS